MSEVPQTRYASTRRGHLAYQVTGAGDRTILYLPGTFRTSRSGGRSPTSCAYTGA
jgi:hypothetical protein